MLGEVLFGKRLLLRVRERRDRVISLQYLVGRGLLDAHADEVQLGEANVEHALGADESERGGAAAAVFKIGDE